MPRNIPTALQTLMATDSYSWAIAVKIVRKDGVQLGFTSWDTPFVLGGLTYTPTSSLQANSLRQASDLSNDQMQVVGILDSTEISDADLMGGKYDNAVVTVMELDPTNLSLGVLTDLNGNVGEITVDEEKYTSEIWLKGKYLSQQVGEIISQTCRVRQLGDAQCKVSMTGFRFNRTVSLANSSSASGGGSAVLQINAGGGAVSPFVADTMFSGGQTDNARGTVIPPTTNAAPTSVYSTYRRANTGTGGSFSYTLTGLTASTPYTVRLHFLEGYFLPPSGHPQQSMAGKRLFEVLINGLTVLTNFDVWAAAGGSDLGITYDFLTSSDTSGHILLQFLDDVNNAMVTAIEVLNPLYSAVSSGILFGSDNAPSGFYNYGRIVYLTGLNAGWQEDIRAHVNVSGSALIAPWSKPPFPVSVGDTATLEAGCDRTGPTCQNKFANLINFHGELYVPGNDYLMSTGRR